MDLDERIQQANARYAAAHDSFTAEEAARIRPAYQKLRAAMLAYQAVGAADVAAVSGSDLLELVVAKQEREAEAMEALRELMRA